MGFVALFWPSKSTYMHGAKIHPYSGQPVAFARLHLRGSWGAFGWILGGLWVDLGGPLVGSWGCSRADATGCPE